MGMPSRNMRSQPGPKRKQSSMVYITGGVIFFLFIAQTFWTPNNTLPRGAAKPVVATNMPDTPDAEAMTPLKVEASLPVQGAGAPAPRVPVPPVKPMPPTKSSDAKKSGGSLPEKQMVTKADMSAGIKGSESAQQYKPEKAPTKKTETPRETSVEAAPAKKMEDSPYAGAKTMTPSIEVEVPTPSFALTALSGGRAWIRVNDRQTVIVKKGDSVPGLGVVSQVDVDSSQVKFENAAPLTLDRSK